MSWIPVPVWFVFQWYCGLETLFVDVE